VGISVPEWKDLERSGIFQYVSPLGGGSVNLTGSSEPARIFFAAVPPNYFALIGVRPQLGRSFNPDDHTPGFNLDCLISDGLWKGAFGADPHILGRGVRLDNDLYQIIGVMPAGYHDPGRTTEERNTQLWLATGFAGPPAPPPQRNSRVLPGAIARIAPGLTVEAAQSRVDALVASLQKEFPNDYPPQSAWKVRLVPLKQAVVGDVRQSLVLLLGAVALVLLISCVNVANLLLARASARGREVAVRQALGAGRKRLMWQLLTEGMLLSLVGGIVGLAILFCAKDFLLQIVPDSPPRLNEVSINWPVLLFALVASLLAGAIFALAPALHVGRPDLTQVLKREGRASTSSGEQARTRRVLMIEVLRRSRTLPGAAEVAAGDIRSIPLGHGRDDLNPYLLTIEGRQIETGQPPLVNVSIIAPDYFHLLGMPLERGRVFGDFDNENTPPVAVINESFAQMYWPNADPVGQHLKLNNARTTPRNLPWTTVVGVIADARTE
jgi:predicted permease